MTTVIAPPTTTTVDARLARLALLAERNHGSRLRSRPIPIPTPRTPLDLSQLLDRLANCESGGNPRAISGSGRWTFYGAFQFLLKTWHQDGGTGNPIDHTYAEQKTVAARIPVSSWRSQFPACSRRLGVA